MWGKIPQYDPKFSGRFFLDLLAAELFPSNIKLQLERCPQSQRPFLPCVVRRMEPGACTINFLTRINKFRLATAGGRRAEGNLHMDTVVPGSSLSLNVSFGRTAGIAHVRHLQTVAVPRYLNVPEMSGGELVLYPIRKDFVQRFL